MSYSCQQCRLVNGSMHQTAWIPSIFAIPNKLIAIVDDIGREEEWTIEEVYGKPVSYKEVNDRSQDYKRTREASDI